MSERSYAHGSVSWARKREQVDTYTTRLALRSQQLELLAVAELDKDVDSPLVVVGIFANADLARTADAYMLG